MPKLGGSFFMVSVGDDPRLTVSGRRTLEVSWLGYWLPRLHKSGFFPPGRPAIQQLIDEIADLIRPACWRRRREKGSACTHEASG
jgi:hypothetical protein